MKDQEQSDEMMTQHFEKRIVIIKNEKRIHRRHAVLEGVGENVHHGLDDRYIQSLLFSRGSDLTTPNVCPLVRPLVTNL